MVIDVDLGSRIIKLRKKNKLTQQELADKLFVTDKTISSWETNRTEPGLEFLVKLSEVFSCSASYLIYGDISKNDIETEIKIKLNKKEFDKLKLLMENEAKLLQNIHHRDTYYQPSHRLFLNDATVNEWLRIGERGNKAIINYKNWHDNMYCDEYETEVSDVDNLYKIFDVIGLRKIAVVDKERLTYDYMNKYEVALDYVDKLGYFVEIEVKKYDDIANVEYDDLLKVARNLDLCLDNIDRRGYPYHFIYKDI